MNVSPDGGGTVKIDQNIPTEYPSISTINNGTSVILEAMPAFGYQFTGWSGSLTSQENPTTLVMTCPKTITANFVQKIHRLNIQIRGAGSVEPADGYHDYVEGTVVDITATPDPGCQFDGWTGDEVADASSASTKITMDSDKTIIAGFSRVRHTLTINVTGAGSVEPSAGTYSYPEGAVVNITAKPSDGYLFEGWTGEVAVTLSPSTTVTMDSDKTITVIFSLPKSTLNIMVEGGGSVNPSAGNHSYAKGAVVDITATPDKGYRFDGWIGDVADADSPGTTVKMNSDKTITANFSKSSPTGLIWGGVGVGAILIIGGIIWLIARRRPTPA